MEEMPDLIQSSFGLNLTSMRLLGLYPWKNHSKVYLVYGYALLFLSLLPDAIFGSLYYILDEELTLFDAGINLLLMVGMVSFIPKLLPLIVSNKKVKDCIYYLEVFNVELDEKQKKIRDDSVWICQRNSRFFVFCTVLDDVMWICRPLIIPQEQDVWLPFDPTENYIAFYSIYVFITLGVTYMAFSNAAIDTLISGLIYHAAGQIKILKDNLEFLFQYAEEKVSSDRNANDAIYQRIRECTRHHYHIINFVRKIEDAFSTIVFSHFLGSTVLICICLLQLVQCKPGSSEFLILCFYLLSLSVETFFYCYYGTTLFEESNTLATAAYMGRWYEYDLKSQKALLLFMERAKIPMTVTAGKIIRLSLHSFTNVLKKAYSLLAVLENY